MPFFDNGQVGGKLRIEHLVESETAQTRNHLSRYQTARSQTHRFTDADPDGRSGLNDDIFFRVQKIVEYLISFIPFDNCAGRAHERALPAVRARNVAESLFHIGRDFALYAAVRKADCIDSLHFRTHRNTPSAQNTLIRIPDNGGRRFI